MLEKGDKMEFCTACRKNTEYTLQNRDIIKTIKEKDYTFHITVAVCNECGEEMNIPGLIDENVREMDEQYRAYEGIVSAEDIEKLMKLYKIGKGPLSLALGFGEITITRYLSGQIPSKEYSDVIKAALTSPAYMKKKLNENKERIAPAAYNKAINAVVQLESIFAVSDQMLRVISYLFKRLEEVTPLMLQKLLYFTQGVSFVLNGKSMFSENCQAWVHGPVYPEVYNMFRDFKYNPIEDERFVIFEGAENQLNEDECRVIDLVADSFGLYSGKVLEKITHEERPWSSARKGYGNDIPSNEMITMESIEAYYIEKNAVYDFSSVEGLRTYIEDVLQRKR